MVIGTLWKSPGYWQRLCLVLALLVSVGGCASDTAQRKRDAERTMNEGYLALSGGNPTLALELLLKAEKQDPENPYIRYNLGMAYLAKDAERQGEQEFKEAIRLKPDYSEAYNTLGVIYLRRGQTEPAIQCFEKALHNILYANPAHAHYNLGRAYLVRKEYDKAREEFERAVNLVPDFAIAYTSLGDVYVELGRNADAKRSYKRAIEFAPNDAEAYLNLGKLLAGTGERADARKMLNEVIRLAPDSPGAAEAQKLLNAMR
jgi:type IV pilus assembly protein PilF